MAKSNRPAQPVPAGIGSPVPMVRPFGPQDAQQIVTYLQKRVRVENLDEATALSTLIQSFVQFANRTFDEIEAAQRAKATPPAPPATPPAPQAGPETNSD